MYLRPAHAEVRKSGAQRKQASPLASWLSRAKSACAGESRVVHVHSPPAAAAPAAAKAAAAAPAAAKAAAAAPAAAEAAAAAPAAAKPTAAKPTAATAAAPTAPTGAAIVQERSKHAADKLAEAIVALRQPRGGGMNNG